MIDVEVEIGDDIELDDEVEEEVDAAVEVAIVLTVVVENWETEVVEVLACDSETPNGDVGVVTDTVVEITVVVVLLNSLQ